MITPLWPMADGTGRSPSRSVSRSQNGRAMIGMKRFGVDRGVVGQEVVVRLDAASISSGSPMVSTLPAPKPATFGYSTCAQIPYSSMRFSRAPTSHVAGSTSASVGGCFGGNSFQPACAADGRRADALGRRSTRRPPGASRPTRTWGTLSPHLSTDEPRRPQVVRLDDVGVGVDDSVLVDVGRKHGSSWITQITGVPDGLTAVGPVPSGTPRAPLGIGTTPALRCQLVPYDDSILLVAGARPV